jgi:hypothetical protein
VVYFGVTRNGRPVEAAKPDTQVPARVQELNKQVEKAYQRGDYRRGLERAQKAYEEAKRSLGAEHPDTLTDLHNLAELQNWIKPIWAGIRRSFTTGLARPPLALSTAP